jgi:hypothetical protein
MRPQDYPTHIIHGIKNNLKWNKIMNAKKQIATLSLIALGAFGTLKAQSSNDNLLAFNDASKAKTEIVLNNNEPVLKEGHSGQAQTISIKKSALVIHVSGGKNAKYSAEKYAKMLQVMFKDSKRTKNPTDISFVYEESNRANTYAMVFSNGRRYDKNGGEYVKGDSVYPINEIVADINNITTHHVANKNRIAAVTPKSKTTQQLASVGDYRP